MHRGFVGADEDASAAEIAQVLHGDFRFLGEAKEALGVIAQQASGVGERGVLGRAVEQPLAHAVFQAPDRLADGRLSPVQLHRGPREAAFGRNLKENAQFGQFHCTTFS